MGRHVPFRWILPVCLLAGWGCSESEPFPSHSAAIYAVDVRTLEPVPGVELFLVDTDTGLIIGLPEAADVNGLVSFQGLSGENYAWFVRRGAGWEPAGLPPRADLWRAGGVQPSNVQMFPLLAAPVGGSPRISGRVVDTVTGDPVPGTVIGLPGWPDRWDGMRPPTGDVAAADGTFLLHDVPFAEDPTGESPPFQIQPLIFQAAGYAPEARLFDAPDFRFSEISGVVVHLRPLGDGGTGGLTGRVTFRGEPVAQADLAASWLGPAVKSGLPHPGLVATTNGEGRYDFASLAPGLWLLEPGYLPWDAWSTPRSVAGPGGLLPVVVRAGETTVVDDLPVLAAVVASFPLPGAQRVDSLPEFRWRGVAAADSYRVFLDRGIAGVTAQEFLVLDPQWALSEGNHLWWVTAETVDGEVVGVTDAYQLFRVGPFE